MVNMVKPLTETLASKVEQLGSHPVQKMDVDRALGLCYRGAIPNVPGRAPGPRTSRTHHKTGFAHKKAYRKKEKERKCHGHRVKVTGVEKNFSRSKIFFCLKMSKMHEKLEKNF